MARGDHPMRTPLYGGLLVIGAMVLATLVGYWTHPPHAVRDVVWGICLVAAIVGLVWTFRDLSPPPRKRR